MRYFTAIISQDEGSAYGVSFPDLPGCFAAADTWDDIPAAVTEALDLWFEDTPDVQPTSLDTLRQRQDVVDAVSSGAVIMAVPYVSANISTEHG